MKNRNNNMNQFSLPEFKNQKYLIAYIDVLGAKEAIINNDRDFFKHLYSTLFIANALSSQYDPRGFWNKAKVKMFSDNLLVAIKINDRNPEIIEQEFAQLTFFIRSYTIPLVQKGYMIRGAITLGDLYVDDIIAWGNSLVEAVFLEEKVAIYPRVIVAHKIIECLKEIDLTKAEKTFETVFKILKDDDGYYYVNMFDPSSGKQSKEMIEDLQEKFKKKLDMCDEDRIKQKINWYINSMKKSYKSVQEELNWWKSKGLNLEE